MKIPETDEYGKPIRYYKIEAATHIVDALLYGSFAPMKCGKGVNCSASDFTDKPSSTICPKCLAKMRAR